MSRTMTISERDYRRLQGWARQDGERILNVWNRMMAAERVRRCELAVIGANRG